MHENFMKPKINEYATEAVWYAEYEMEELKFSDIGNFSHWQIAFVANNASRYRMEDGVVFTHIWLILEAKESGDYGLNVYVASERSGTVYRLLCFYISWEQMGVSDTEMMIAYQESNYTRAISDEVYAFVIGCVREHINFAMFREMILVGNGV